MLAIGTTKLQLDDAVGGEEITLDGEAGGVAQKEDKTAKEVRKSLLTTLRNKFVAGAGTQLDGVEEDVKGEQGADVKMEETITPVKKVARAAAASQVPVKEE
jgi:SWI/SNF-related matrix-associated actin-dependent regulator 1 of chromatin subfamily A